VGFIQRGAEFCGAEESRQSAGLSHSASQGSPEGYEPLPWLLAACCIPPSALGVPLTRQPYGALQNPGQCLGSTAIEVCWR